MFYPISEEEKSTFKALRRSLVASRNINKGEVLTIDMINIMRPGNGLSTEFIDMIIGNSCNKNILKHQTIIIFY